MDRNMKIAVLTGCILFAVVVVLVKTIVDDIAREKVEIIKSLPLPMRTQMYQFGRSEEFRTADGMPCMVFTNDIGAGLRCDWGYEE